MCPAWSGRTGLLPCDVGRELRLPIPDLALCGVVVFNRGQQRVPNIVRDRDRSHASRLLWPRFSIKVMGVHKKRNRSASTPGAIRRRSKALQSEPPLLQKAYGRRPDPPRSACCPFRSVLCLRKFAMLAAEMSIFAVCAQGAVLGVGRTLGSPPECGWI